MFQRSFINISLTDSRNVEEDSQVLEDSEVNCSFLNISLKSPNLNELKVCENSFQSETVGEIGMFILQESYTFLF